MLSRRNKLVPDDGQPLPVQISYVPIAWLPSLPPLG